MGWLKFVLLESSGQRLHGSRGGSGDAERVLRQ
jgi:hypothetical protein